MTYVTNGVAQTQDYNNLIGDSNLVAAPSSAIATQKAGYLWGVGYGDRGYGQTTPALSLITNKTIQTNEWNTLRSILLSMGNQQGLILSNLPPVVNAGNIIEHQQGFSLALISIDTGRLNSTSGGKTLFTNQASSTRGSTWGTNAVPSISATLLVSFSDENNARYFFNTGGTINFNLSHPSVTTPQNQNWNQVLSALGTILFSANNTNRTGSGGTTNAIGYYNLTTSYQTIFNGTNIGGGAYSSNDVLIEAQRESFVGQNGANGAEIRFRITLSDQHSNVFSDLVAAGTNCTIAISKSTSFVAGIQTPSCSFTTNF